MVFTARMPQHEADEVPPIDLHIDIETRVDATPLAEADARKPYKAGELDTSKEAFVEELTWAPSSAELSPMFRKLGPSLPAFLEQHLGEVLSVVGHSTAHEQIELIDQFKQALDRARAHDKALRAKQRLVKEVQEARRKAEGRVLGKELRPGQLVRYCEVGAGRLPDDIAKTTFRVRRRTPKARKFSVIAIDGPRKGQSFQGNPDRDYLVVKSPAPSTT